VGVNTRGHGRATKGGQSIERGGGGARSSPRSIKIGQLRKEKLAGGGCKGGKQLECQNATTKQPYRKRVGKRRTGKGENIRRGEGAKKAGVYFEAGHRVIEQKKCNDREKSRRHPKIAKRGGGGGGERSSAPPDAREKETKMGAEGRQGIVLGSSKKKKTPWAWLRNWRKKERDVTGLAGKKKKVSIGGEWLVGNLH